MTDFMYSELHHLKDRPSSKCSHSSCDAPVTFGVREVADGNPVHGIQEASGPYPNEVAEDQSTAHRASNKSLSARCGKLARALQNGYDLTVPASSPEKRFQQHDMMQTAFSTSSHVEEQPWSHQQAWHSIENQDTPTNRAPAKNSSSPFQREYEDLYSIVPNSAEYSCQMGTQLTDDPVTPTRSLSHTVPNTPSSSRTVPNTPSSNHGTPSSITPKRSTPFQYYYESEVLDKDQSTPRAAQLTPSVSNSKGNGLFVVESEEGSVQEHPEGKTMEFSSEDLFDSTAQTHLYSTTLACNVGSPISPELSEQRKKVPDSFSEEPLPKNRRSNRNRNWPNAALRSWIVAVCSCTILVGIAFKVRYENLNSVRIFTANSMSCLLQFLI